MVAVVHLSGQPMNRCRNGEASKWERKEYDDKQRLKQDFLGGSEGRMEKKREGEERRKERKDE
ncbi:hypothetical protein LOAG_18982 [Loa loa]|uniref:Uncharacterized protein n=1 Tax=Loa loa TaxID=7209 RepID=A0A1S0UDU4_LOALO|nr:hypothetical protein LOAG_18982 [Loa loa]EJD73601.1 hypothetical protein LOAG_18982 [Loa loa]